MREPAGAPAGTERREEGTRASAPAHNAGSARGSSCTHHSSARFLFLATTNFCAIVCLPADRTTHACPTQTCVRGTKLTRRGVSRSAAVATVPPKQNKHDLGLPTHYVFATVRVLDDRLLFGILQHSCHSLSGDNFRSTWTAVLRVSWQNTEQPRSTALHHWVAEHRSARARSGSGVLLLFLLIQTSTHHSLPQQHRLADDQPAAARHELSEHRLLSSRRGGAQITSTRVHVYVRISDKPKNPNEPKSTTDRIACPHDSHDTLYTCTYVRTVEGAINDGQLNSESTSQRN